MSKAFLTATCLLALSMPVSAAAPKDYYFPEVKVEVTVASDGTFLVDEYRTFEFEGSFSYAYIVIPLRIERLGVRREVEVSGLVVTDEQGMPLRMELDEESAIACDRDLHLDFRKIVVLGCGSRHGH